MNTRILEFPRRSPVSGSMNTLCMNTSRLRKEGLARLRVALSSSTEVHSPDSKDIVTDTPESVG